MVRKTHRRRVLMGLGIAGLGTLSGCASPVRFQEPGGGTTAAQWMYDPDVIHPSKNTGYFTVDGPAYRDAADTLPRGITEAVTTLDSEFDTGSLADISFLSGVAFVDFSGQTTPWGISFVLKGQFNPEKLESDLRSWSNRTVSRQGEYKGYQIYRLSSSYQTRSEWGFAASAEAVVVSLVNTGEADSIPALKATIDAKREEAHRLSEANSNIRSLLSHARGEEARAGASINDEEVSEALFQSEPTTSLNRAFKDVITGLEAVGVGGSEERSIGRAEFVLAYDDQAAANSDRVRDLIDEAEQASPRIFDHITSVSVKKGGREVVIRAQADLEELSRALDSAGNQVQDVAPQASFTFDYRDGRFVGDCSLGNDGTLVITHDGGDRIGASQLTVHGSDREQVAVTDCGWTSGDEIGAGARIRVEIDSSDVIRIVWHSGDGSDSATLGKFTGPTA